MGVLVNNWEFGGFGSGIWRRILVLFLCFSLMISMGCSSLSSSNFFMVQNDDYLLHEVDRDGWVTTNQGFGSVRPPLMSIDIADDGKLTIYPVCLGVNLDMFGPPFLPLIWIPRFMHLPPRHPLNTLHFVYTGRSGDLRVVSVNDVPINQESVVKEELNAESHYYLSIEEYIGNAEVIKVSVFVDAKIIRLVFAKIRSVNCFPFFVPL